MMDVFLNLLETDALQYQNWKLSPLQMLKEEDI